MNLVSRRAQFLTLNSIELFFSEAQCGDGGNDSRCGSDGIGRAEVRVSQLVPQHSKELRLLHRRCKVRVPNVSPDSCEIDFASVLTHDALGLSERASQVFRRHNQADRKRGFSDARLQKRLLQGVGVEVVDVLLVATRDRDLLELLQRSDRHSFHVVRDLHSLTGDGAIVCHVCIWAGGRANLLQICCSVGSSEDVDVLGFENLDRRIIALESEVSWLSVGLIRHVHTRSHHDSSVYLCVDSGIVHGKRVEHLGCALAVADVGDFVDASDLSDLVEVRRHVILAHFEHA